MGEEMERSVYRGDWSSEMSHLIGWSSDISLVKQIGNEAAAVCDDSMAFSEPKEICSQLQFSHELGIPSSIWGQDLLSSSRGGINRFYTAPVINNMQIKREHPFSNLDSESLLSISSPLPTPKASDMPPLFPATVGERTSPPLSSKARPSAYCNNSPLWTGRSSGLSLSQKNQERSTTCNVVLKDSCMDTKKSNDENAPKRIRSDAHVPFTTFKVRKEKLGDRITALQQLVSPFGKTDTASVLFDAIEYIRFLHDQVTVLSTPYMMLSHELSGTSMEREEAARKGGLRSRGLCLVPISTTMHVARDNTPDFWAPTFGGSYR